MITAFIKQGINKVRSQSDEGTHQTMIRLILCFTLSILTSNAQAEPVQGFFFFGDSLTDSGYQNNNPIIKNIDKSPIWTSPNGHTWAYYFLQHYAKQYPHTHTGLLPNNKDAKTRYNPVPNNIIPNLDGNNFSAGGSTTEGPGVLNSKTYKAPSLLDQIHYFTTSYAPQHHVAIAQQEYFIWSGSNNLMKKLVIEMTLENVLQKLYLGKPAAALHLFNFKKLSTRFSKTETQIADNLLTAVTSLKKVGAQRIVILLLPNMGDAPLIKTLSQDLKKNGSNTLTTTEFSTQIGLVTQATNALIREKLRHEGVKFIDVNEILHPLIAMKTPGYFKETPQQFGGKKTFLITNHQTPACPPGEPALTCIPTTENAIHYVFEDAIHPTDQTHQIIGDYVYYQTQLSVASKQ